MTSQLVTRLYVDGVPLPLTNTRLVLDEGWAPYAAATLTVPYTPERAAALDPRNHVRIGVEVSRYWSGSITLDDLSDRWYTPPTPPGPPAVVLRTNLHRNPTVGAPGTTGWTANYGLGGTGVLTHETSGGKDGPDFVRLTWTTGSTDVYRGLHSSQTFVSIGLGFHTVSVWVRVNRPQRLWLGNLVGTVVLKLLSAPQVVVPANTWTRLEAHVEATTAGQWELRVYAVAGTNGRVWAPGDTLDADAFLVEKLTTVEPYFDGSTPDTADRDYAWTGPANASTSTESTVFDPGDPGTTLDDLSAAWAGLTLDDLSAAWGIDWGNGIRPPETITADLILRERTIDHAAATISLRAGSDELLAQDARAYVERPVEPLPERLMHLLDAGHVPIGPPPDFSAGDPFVAMPAQTVEWSQTIWDSMQANATSCGLRLWCDEARVWRLGFPDAAPAVSVDLPYVSDAGDQVNRDGDYADVLVWIGKGINDEALPVTETKTWPPVLPAGPYRTAAVEHDYGQVGASIPMPSDDELAARLALLQSRDRVLSLTAVADPTLRPGMGVTTGPPSLPVTASTVARVEWAVPADTMTLTTRSTTEA